MSSPRAAELTALAERRFDVCIIGGGINGAVSAAALAARGASVALIDKGDFGGATSSNSSNLVWGGIKYLEAGEFRLVASLCKSRNQLMREYPSSIREIRFLTTVRRGFRMPTAAIYAGTFFYWLLGRCATRAPRLLSRRRLAATEPRIAMAGARGAVEYSDAYLVDNDSRFVFNFVRGAMDAGASAANYVEATGAKRASGGWAIEAVDRIGGKPLQLRASVLINAGGPGVDAVNRSLSVATRHRHVFSKGVHLIVDRLVETDRILAFFASDGRLFFVIPMGIRTCIGTTDERVDDAHARVTDDDRQFILDNANEMLSLERPLTAGDILSERCGVRPLAVSGGQDDTDTLRLSRRHAIDCDSEASLISIFGGKLTDCLNIGREVAERVAALGVALQPTAERWYGEPSAAVRNDFMARARQLGLNARRGQHTGEPVCERLWRRYGRDAFEFLDAIRDDAANAERVLDCADYLRCEFEYARRREMIARLDDFLRRRSKIGMVVN
ncbi:MAG: glycerol-3-phosphate dehydrogenase/oxidase, partial [Pseudomonadota bacterium]